MSNQTRSEPERTQAAVRRSWWPGWIWGIPIAALLLVGWWTFRTFMSEGENITISFDNAHGLKESNTKLVYRGMNVGKATGIALARDGNSVNVTVQVQDDATKFLRSGTRFWLRGTSPSLSDLSSLGSVLSGPTIVMEPGPGKKQSHFVGLPQAPVISASHGPAQIYEVALNGNVGKLKQGEPVKLRGFTVGEVKDVGFRYDASTEEVATPVTLALYPSLFHIEGAAEPNGNAALASAIDHLIQKGLHARLERDPPLVGDPQVTLDIAPDASSATARVVNGAPQIPSAPDSGINSIVERVNKVPIEQIGQNVLNATQQADALVSSPQLGDAIAQLDATLNQLRQTADSSGPQITRLLERLRKTAGQLDDAAKTADRVLGGTASQNGTQQAMREITEAARSVRDLANYLDRHPEALVRGRSEE